MTHTQSCLCHSLSSIVMTILAMSLIGLVGPEPQQPLRMFERYFSYLDSSAFWITSTIVLWMTWVTSSSTCNACFNSELKNQSIIIGTIWLMSSRELSQPQLDRKIQPFYMELSFLISWLLLTGDVNS